jgi:hypothetical protein
MHTERRSASTVGPQPVLTSYTLCCDPVNSLVPESILKKRRTLEQVKAKRAAKVAAESVHRKKVRQIAFKSAEKYVKEYRQVSSPSSLYRHLGSSLSRSLTLNHSPSLDREAECAAASPGQEHGQLLRAG